MTVHLPFPTSPQINFSSFVNLDRGNTSGNKCATSPPPCLWSMSVLIRGRKKVVRDVLVDELSLVKVDDIKEPFDVEPYIFLHMHAWVSQRRASLMPGIFAVTEMTIGCRGMGGPFTSEPLRLVWSQVPYSCGDRGRSEGSTRKRHQAEFFFGFVGRSRLLCYKIDGSVYTITLQEVYL